MEIVSLLVQIVSVYILIFRSLSHGEASPRSNHLTVPNEMRPSLPAVSANRLGVGDADMGSNYSIHSRGSSVKSISSNQVVPAELTAPSRKSSFVSSNARSYLQPSLPCKY